MKTLVTLLIPLFIALGVHLNPTNLRGDKMQCEIYLDDVYLSLGDSHVIETELSCPTSDIESVQWFPLDSLNCNSLLCLNPTVSPHYSTCYTINVIWKNKASSSAEICVNMRDCYDPFDEDKLTNVSPQNVDSLTTISFELAEKQYCYFDLVKDNEVVLKLWDGWIGLGNRQLEFDLSSVDSGSYEIRGSFANSCNSVSVTKN